MFEKPNHEAASGAPDRERFTRNEPEVPSGAGHSLVRLYKYFYLPYLLEKKELHRAIVFAAIFLVFGGFFVGRMYVRLTVSVPEAGGVYREGLLRTPRTINPLYASTNDTDRDLARLIFSRLITYDGSGNPVLDLAERYEIRENGKIYTVYIRGNAYWHDEKKVTADDIVFTVHTIQNPAYRSPFISNWQGVDVEKKDDYTVEFTLRAPYTPFLENLTVGILPKHLWENIPPEQAIIHELNLKPVGSGPYMFDRFTQAKDGTISEYRLMRNPDYYRTGPFIETIVFQFYSSLEILLTEWRKGNIDGFSPISENIKNELNESRYTLYSVDTPRVFGIFFNTQKSGELAERKIREAIAEAIPKEKVAGYTFGAASPHDSPFPPFYGIPSGSGTGTPISFDPERAATLLQNLGYARASTTGILEKTEKKQEGKKTVEKKSTLSFTLTTSDWPDLQRAAEVIQQGLNAVGIDITISAMPLSELDASAIRPRNFELLLFGHAYGYEPDPFIFWHSSQTKDPGLNIVRYSDKASDKLLEEVRTITDRGERARRLAELEGRLQSELLMVPLFAEHYLYILPSDIRGVNLVVISVPSDRFNTIDQWYIYTKRILK